jgi:hypothetical protein
MTDLEQAKDLLKAGGFSCVLFRDGASYTSTKRGVAPLVDWLAGGTDIKGFSAADKIVGKAAALLFVAGDVKEVYAPIMSETAAEVLARHGIHTEYETLVRTIINRSGTGPCPMEQAVSSIDNPAETLRAIQNTMAALAAAKEG